MLRTSVRALYQIRKVGEDDISELVFVSPKTQVHIHNITVHQMSYDDFVVPLSSFWQMKRVEYFFVC